MKKSARIIVTLVCNRNCTYCCNTGEGMLDLGKRITSLEGLDEFDEFNLTGGEPLMFPVATLAVIEKLKELYPNKPIHLYTAFFASALNRFPPKEAHDILSLVTGITYTLHSGADDNDLIQFDRVQSILSTFDNKLRSDRLALSPDIKDTFGITPSVWKEIRIKTWKAAADCTLPEHEQLFILE